MAAGPPTVRTGVLSLHQWRLWLTGLIGSRYDGLAHFHVVEPGVLMRCGQPRIRDLEQLRGGHGLKTIVCARGGTRHPLRGRWFRRQKQWCAAAGIRFEHMPFSDCKSPPAEVFDRFLDIVSDPANRPVLVHCEQGFHRTGVLCAAYRIRGSGWTIEEALDEMGRYGFELKRHKRRPLIDMLRRWAEQNGSRADGSAAARPGNGN